LSRVALAVQSGSIQDESDIEQLMAGLPDGVQA
jgi:hypothetical protein